MKKEITDILKAHREYVQQARSMYEGVEKALWAEYQNRNAPGYTSRNKEAMRVRDEAIQGSRQQTLKACRDTLDDVRGKIRAFAATPVDPTFPAAMAALQAMKNPTKAELDMIAGQYSNNYLCYRAICDTLGGSAAGFRSITLDDMLAECDKVQKAVEKAMNGDVEAYGFRVLEAGHIIGQLEENCTYFLGGHFDNLATNKQDTQE